MSSKRHFGMDERGLGGTYMIQQQFLDMYRKIHHAKKTVDNEPPQKTMFRRPYFSNFGDYYKRIGPSQVKAEAKVDTSAPVSYDLIADLYINQPSGPAAAAKKREKKRLATPSTAASASAGGGGGKRSSVVSGGTPRSTPRSKRMSSVDDLRRSCSTANSGVAARDPDVTTSLEEYMLHCDNRRQAIAAELKDLKKRRLLRLCTNGYVAGAAGSLSGSPANSPHHGGQRRPSGAPPLSPRSLSPRQLAAANGDGLSAVARTLMDAIEEEDEKETEVGNEEETVVGTQSVTSPEDTQVVAASPKGRIGSITNPSATAKIPTKPTKTPQRPQTAGQQQAVPSRGTAKRRSDFGPPVSKLVIPKKNVFNRPSMTPTRPVASAGELTGPRPRRVVHHHYGVVAPYDADGGYGEDEQELMRYQYQDEYQ